MSLDSRPTPPKTPVEMIWREIYEDFDNGSLTGALANPAYQRYRIGWVFDELPEIWLEIAPKVRNSPRYMEIVGMVPRDREDVADAILGTVNPDCIGKCVQEFPGEFPSFSIFRLQIVSPHTIFQIRNAVFSIATGMVSKKFEIRGNLKFNWGAPPEGQRREIFTYRDAVEQIIDVESFDQAQQIVHRIKGKL